MTFTARFIPALDISRQLADVIAPRLREMFADTPLCLAFLGAGSDVLGYDTARSMDHDWGPRLTIVVPDDEVSAVRSGVDSELDTLLPEAVSGFPTRFSHHEDNTLFPDSHGSIHRLEVTSVKNLLGATVGTADIADMTAAHWLSTPMQSLLEFTSGAVFVDDTGELTRAREHFSFYPDDIWRYQLAALWMRVSQVNPFIGRAGELEDNIGSAVITATIARDLMRIALLQSKCYVPYSKWLGTACAQFEIGLQIQPHLNAALVSSDWRGREEGINTAGLALVEQLNTLPIIESVPVETEQFHSRPFTVLPAERIAHGLQASLSGTECEHLPLFVGGIDIVTDATDASKSADFQGAFRRMMLGT